MARRWRISFLRSCSERASMRAPSVCALSRARIASMPPGSSTMAPSMSALVSISSTRMPFCVPADLAKHDEGTHGNHQHRQPRHGDGRLREDRDHRRQTGGHGGGEVHEHQLDQFHRALQAAIEAAMDVAGHVGAEIGQRRHQQRERGLLACGFFPPGRRYPPR